MGLLRLCLLSSLVVFLFSQVLYLINDLSLTCVQTSLLSTFFVTFYVLTFLPHCCDLLHVLIILLLSSLFSEIEGLYTD